MYRFYILIIVTAMIVSCKDKQVSLAGNDTVDYKAFAAAFSDIKLPYKLADTNMVKLADTTNISYTVFSEFVPDSALVALLGKSAAKNKIKPLGKIQMQHESYLLAEFTANKKTTLATFAFDEKQKYLAGLLLLKSESKDDYLHSLTVTTEPTFIVSREKYNADNSLLYTRNGFAFSKSGGEFTEVVNDTNEDLKRNNEVINPIDTFPRLNKLSGDYILDKKNFISVRDDGSARKLQFFIHFEKNGGDCTGELKGMMTLRDGTHAYYQENGDPCVIDFEFLPGYIKVKEEGNCGNHRGIKCYFNDTYKKKKEPKPAGKKKAK